MTLSDFLSQAGITERSFGDAIGVTQSAVSKYCKGLRRPRPTVVLAIMKATGGKVTANDFLPD